MGTTKQAASKLVDTMVVGGYLRRGMGDEDRRQRPIHITTGGQALLTTVEQIYVELEGDWAAVIGASSVERLRRDLVRVLSNAQEGGLPPVRPTR
jgi:DNA-binding MarR family transcriptional regulator